MQRSGNAERLSAVAVAAVLLCAPRAPAQSQALPADVALAPAPLELGMFGGVLVPSVSHELLERGPHQRYARVGPELGTRFGFFPVPALGLELEGAIMPSETRRGDMAGLWASRAQLAFRLPRGRFAAFSVLGLGLLGAASNELGSDADPALHVGIGASFALDDFLGLRLDLRDTVTQKYARSAGVQTHHPEVLLGLSFAIRPHTRTPAPEAPR